jgi:hypothetical protein
MLVRWRLLRRKAALFVGIRTWLLRVLWLRLSAVVLLGFRLRGRSLLLLQFRVRPFLEGHLVVW